jgi:ribonuclease G
MNKELFVSSTPHETKVGLVEDDLLAEVYLERENEYTLAGSIYKGRVTRVLPGMQSAFVDIGLERDAFLYVSDFMELEEHDEDVTDVVPANRAVQDFRGKQGAVEATESNESPSMQEAGFEPQPGGESAEFSSNRTTEGQEAASNSAPVQNSGESQDRDRGGWRGRRRRRGGSRRDGRDRGSDSRSTRNEATAPRSETARTSQFTPSASYQPILLPGESISKYRGLAQTAPVHESPHETETSLGSASYAEAVSGTTAPLAAAFPDDEPIFADGSNGISLEADSPSGSTNSENGSSEWGHEVHSHEPTASTSAVEEEFVEEDAEPVALFPEQSNHADSHAYQPESPAFAAPGTIEEETIEEEEVEAAGYEASSDDGYEEFEEETRAVGQASDNGQSAVSDVRETVAEIHMNSLAESGAPSAEGTPADSEEDSEELELEEAQAEAEAMLDAEARGNGTVDARAEVRAPATAGYTQRSSRPRPAYERRTGGRRGGRRFPRRQTQNVPQISDLLKEGQEILVQIAKEPIGKKGARITSHIALPGRFLVYMPTVNHTGVSRKIASEEERQRLKRIVLSERENGHGGFIVRTAAQNASEDELRADIRFLKGLWNDIKTRSENSKPPALIYHDLNVVERVLRDQVTSDFSVIWVDTEPEYERILRFFNRFQPGLVKRVKLYTKETPLFEQFGLAEEMNKALKSKVWLKSGGYIVINQTEALVAIDINTGKYVGKTSRLEDTIVKTNVDAIKEIVRQIRLRDLGGIIIIDFIDMDERRNRQRVMQALEEELRHDRAPSKVLQFNDFGLVAITRKRVKQSLERTIGAPCPYCQSTGYVKSLTTVANEIYVEMRKIAKHLEHEDVMLRVNPDVAKELKANNGRLLNEMEELTKRTIIVKSDPALHQEQFDIN